MVQTSNKKIKYTACDGCQRRLVCLAKGFEHKKSRLKGKASPKNCVFRDGAVIGYEEITISSQNPRAVITIGL